MEEQHDIEAGLDRLEAQAEQAEAVEAEYIPGTGEPEQPEPAAPAIRTGEALAMLVKTVCDLVARRRGAHWKLSRDEATAAGEAYGAVLDTWIPVEKMGPMLTAVTVSAVVFGPRVAVDRQLRREVNEKEAAKAKESGAHEKTD